MASEVITKNDLTAILDKTFSNKSVLISTGSVSVTATAQTLTFCSLTLAPNTKYLIFSNVASNKGGTVTILNNISVESAITSAGGLARVTTSSGQGVSNWRYVEIGENGSAATLTGYSYTDGGTGYIQSGVMIAIPLNTM